ncbi:tripartite tricarboxylate transporter TctB family protein [Promicromonospora thailandica]|uniref:Tricarboxylic transport membrane protein n=1 Tax=Promicromonospora thailandica TaxID=765201 RepID=A0A9X2JUF3_9MICO|nr:tripartite tricarboxylate transporter TctB family protein [Promicromonospora thailandica]MCP2263402.1 putative tricarboxylic transport membrane protein [Promicromonospora thailandica]BFF19437.1 tripartite tricarboxylate transporter TctB family protein [Promicromonospora thailandica]
MSADGSGPAADVVAPRRRWGELVLAAATAALGGYVLVAAGDIVVPGSTNTLGPRAFPYLVGAMLVAAGVVLVILVLTGRAGQEEGGEDVDPTVRTDWLTVGLLVAALVVHVFTINVLGWPFAAALLFAAAAVVLGARPWWRAALVGLVLGLVIQVVFGGLLGLSLPPGPLLEGVPFLRG